MTISSILVRKEQKFQKLIYYMSKVLQDVETCCIRLKKMIFTLIILIRKLKPYFQAHIIVVLTYQPLKAILNHPNTLEQIAKWALELAKFNIMYQLKPSIKVQVPMDFILECIILEEERIEEST